MIRSNTMQLITRTRLVTILTLIMLAFAALPAMPARAATITISDQASCEAFGGEVISGACRFYHPVTIAAGDVLQLNMRMQMARTLTIDGTMNIGSGGRLENYATVNNNGVIAVSGGGSIANVQGDFNNNGTITVACGASVSGPISGNPPQYPADCTGPTVTVNQAAGQADPTNASPINFTVVFGENVTGFTSNDVALSGTAGATSAVVTGSGSTYNVAVSGMSTSGTVIVSIPAGAVQDAAGNGSTASTSTDNTVTFISDSTAPVITPTVAGTLSSNGWYVSDVAVSWSVVDNESAISAQSGCGSSTVNNDTTGVTFTCTATSAGGTNSQSVTVKRDATAPTISFAGRTAPNAAGWNNSAVTVQWSCSDATSGAVSANVSQMLSSDGANQSATGACMDKAGNSASDTQTGINIDTTAPTLAPVVSPNPVLLNGAATVTANASDARSGLASQSCGTLDTSRVGSKSVSCTASDNAGNSASASANYNVIYPWSGFFQPVDNLPTLNSVKAGQAIPVKFSLGGNQGLSIFASGYPVSRQIACDGGVPLDDIEQTVTAEASSSASLPRLTSRLIPQHYRISAV